jgi:hypothetical protein
MPFLCTLVTSMAAITLSLISLKLAVSYASSSFFVCAILNRVEAGDWLKIDDDRVTKVDAKEAIEGNYGSDAAVNTSEGASSDWFIVI